MEKASSRYLSLRSFLLVLVGMLLGAGLTLAVLFYHSSANPAGKLAGTWRGTAEVAGTEISLTLKIQNQGKNLTGQIDATPGGVASFDSISVDSLGNFSCSLHVAEEDVTFTGKLAADERSMTGKLTTTAHGDGTWSLAKDS